MLASVREATSLLGDATLQQLKEDRVLQLALTHLVETIGEAARRVSEPERRQRASVPWQAIMVMRNRLAHDYRNIELEVLYQTVCHDLPHLIDLLG